SCLLASRWRRATIRYSSPYTMLCAFCASFAADVAFSSGATQPDIHTSPAPRSTDLETPPTAPTGYTFGTPTFTPSATVTIPAGNGSANTETMNNPISRDLDSLQSRKSLSNPNSAPVRPNFSDPYECGVGHTGHVTDA